MLAVGFLFLLHFFLSSPGISFMHKSIGEGVLLPCGACRVDSFFGKLDTGGNVSSFYLPTLMSKPTLAVIGIFSSDFETEENVDSTSEYCLCLHY